MVNLEGFCLSNGVSDRFIENIINVDHQGDLSLFNSIVRPKECFKNCAMIALGWSERFEYCLGLSLFYSGEVPVFAFEHAILFDNDTSSFVDPTLQVALGLDIKDNNDKFILVKKYSKNQLDEFYQENGYAPCLLDLRLSNPRERFIEYHH